MDGAPEEVARGEPLVAVLAGGHSSRMGRKKAAVLLAGRPLISYPLAAARAAGLQAVVVARADSELPPLDAETLVEDDGPRHPLWGLIAALRRAAAAVPPRPVLAVACDMPFLTGALLGAIARSGEHSLALVVGGRLQPFPALVGCAHLPALERDLAREGPLRDALQALRPRLLAEPALRAFGDPRRLCFSVDDDVALQRAGAFLGAAA